MNGPGTPNGRLRREVGLAGASLLGLGSMVGTGVFVSIGIAAGVAGPSLMAATFLAALVAGGIRRSSRGNAVIVGLTLAPLVALVGLSVPVVLSQGLDNFTPFLPASAEGPGGYGALLHGAALMFVAFTGYGRIATLAEEVREPGRVIPPAVVVTMGIVTALYLGVAFAGVGVLGAEEFGRAAEEAAAPLEAVAAALGVGWLPLVIALAAITAMLGVLLNLVLGLSRVLLAMARRGDAPAAFQRIGHGKASPVRAVWACGLVVAGLVLIGDVRTTWSFSAFTVLLYYGITNLAALRLPPGKRLFPPWIPAFGLAGCLGLAFWVESTIWMAGLALLALGLAGHAVRHRLFPS